jgi:hypothetical protein
MAEAQQRLAGIATKRKPKVEKPVAVKVEPPITTAAAELGRSENRSAAAQVTGGVKLTGSEPHGSG